MVEKQKSSNPSSVRLSNEGRELQSLLAKHFGISKTAVLELALRSLAKQEGVSAEKSNEK